MGISDKEELIFKKKFQEIINNIDVGFFISEFKGKLLIHNISVNKILGLDPAKDLTGSLSTEFFSNPEELKRYNDNLTKNGYVKDFIVNINRPDGNPLYVQINSYLIKTKNQPLLVEGIITNVKENYLLDQNLKESEKKFNLILDNINDLIAILNSNFEHIFINENAYLNLLGYTKEEVIGKRPRDFIHPDDIKLVSTATKKGLFRGEMVEEYRIRHKKGHYIWVETKGSFLNKNNNIMGAIFISRDITDKKEAEEKLKESENKYRTLFESSTDGIYSTDMEGNFIEFNRAFLKILGYSKEEMIKKNIREITPNKWYEMEDDITFTQLSEGESKVYEKEFIKRDGTTLPVSIRFWILYDEQDDPHTIWAIVRDITERKEIEHKLIEINRLKSEFLSRASHELKTPLVSIKGFSNLILSSYKEELNSDISSKLEEVNRGCERLNFIINDLLHASRLESLELKPKFESEDLSFLINYCLEELHPLSAEREQSINIEIHDSIITKFEKEEIHDVISNLLINAIKYTPPKKWLEIKTEIKDNFVIVSIKDNGIGFTEEEKGKIFQQFGKIERYGQGLDLGIDGTGLGLYISKKIIEAHGGKIWMESEGRNKGSTFYFSLPLIDD